MSYKIGVLNVQRCKNRVFQLNPNFYIVNSNCAGSCETDDFTLAMLFITLFDKEKRNCFIMSHDNMNWFTNENKQKAIFNLSHNDIIENPSQKYIKDFITSLTKSSKSHSPPPLNRNSTRTSPNLTRRSRSPPRFSTYSSRRNTRTHRPTTSYEKPTITSTISTSGTSSSNKTSRTIDSFTPSFMKF